jgi:predicted RNase H-like HicB family nuclease
MKHIKVIVEKHADGYVAYPLGLKGIVVGEGDTYEEALADVRSAIQFHMSPLVWKFSKQHQRINSKDNVHVKYKRRWP